MRRLAGITADELRAALEYDPGTGIFRWRGNRRWRPDLGGAVAGNATKRYITIHFRGSSYAAHRLAWLYVHGEWPDFDIDHRDGNKHNNAIANLRAASRSQNCCNVGLRKSSRSGFKGVSWKTENQKWCAQIQIERKSVFIGYFTSREDAAAAYDAKACELHGEYARPNGEVSP